MFAVIYQVSIKAKREAEFTKAWHQIATYFIEERGSLGSSLHRTENGLWVAYSRWPDKATRDASWPGQDAPSTELPDDIREAIITLKNCIENQLPEICMEVVDDLLATAAVL